MFDHSQKRSPTAGAPPVSKGKFLTDNRMHSGTLQTKSKVNVNDDDGPEREADAMDTKTLQPSASSGRTGNSVLQKSAIPGGANAVVQREEIIQVNETKSQQLIDQGKSTAKTYSWQSSFWIHLYNGQKETPRVEVVIRIATSASDKVFEAWSASVGAAWNKKFAIKSGSVQYPITVEIRKVEKTDKLKNYDVQSVKQEKSHGNRGLFGTESMTVWGETDPQDIPHEVGHMLGNKDEYGTVDGRDWDKEYNASETDERSIMNRGDKPPRMDHFSLILDAIKKSGKLENPALVKYMRASAYSSAIPLFGMSSTKGSTGYSSTTSSSDAQSSSSSSAMSSRSPSLTASVSTLYSSASQSKTPVVVSTEKTTSTANTNKLATPLTTTKTESPSNTNKLVTPLSTTKTASTSLGQQTASSANTNKLVTPLTATKTVSSSPTEKTSSSANTNKLVTPLSTTRTESPSNTNKVSTPLVVNKTTSSSLDKASSSASLVKTTTTSSTSTTTKVAGSSLANRNTSSSTTTGNYSPTNTVLTSSQASKTTGFSSAQTTSSASSASKVTTPSSTAKTTVSSSNIKAKGPSQSGDLVKELAKQLHEKRVTKILDYLEKAGPLTPDQKSYMARFNWPNEPDASKTIAQWLKIDV